MRWSKLKTLVESRFCPEVCGRLELHSTGYRGAHDEQGRAWVTFDKEEIYSACDLKGRNTAFANARRIRAEHPDLELEEVWAQAWDAAWKKGCETRRQFHQSLYVYLDLSIEDALASQDDVIRALAIVDRRLGKRRMRQLAVRANEHPLLRRLYEIRIQAEREQSSVPREAASVPSAKTDTSIT